MAATENSDPLTHRRPTVGVVVATRNRPGPLRAALASILGQEYAGDIEVVVVFDQSEPDATLAQPTGDRRVRVVDNVRTPGLAGGRNTGIMSLDTE